MSFQLPIPSYDLSYYDLVDSENEIVNYISHLNLGRIEKVLSKYYSGQGPYGFRKISFFLMDVIKIKKNIPSNRRLIKELREQKFYQNICLLTQTRRSKRYNRKSNIPCHQAISKFHRKIGIKGFRELLALTVEEANELGLLEAKREFYRNGIHLATDSTFISGKINLENFLKR